MAAAAEDDALFDLEGLELGEDVEEDEKVQETKLVYAQVCPPELLAEFKRLEQMLVKNDAYGGGQLNGYIPFDAIKRVFALFIVDIPVPDVEVPEDEILNSISFSVEIDIILRICEHYEGYHKMYDFIINDIVEKSRQVYWIESEAAKRGIEVIKHDFLIACRFAWRMVRDINTEHDPFAVLRHIAAVKAYINMRVIPLYEKMTAGYEDYLNYLAENWQLDTVIVLNMWITNELYNAMNIQLALAHARDKFNKIKFQEKQQEYEQAVAANKLNDCQDTRIEMDYAERELKYARSDYKRYLQEVVFYQSVVDNTKHIEILKQRVQAAKIKKEEEDEKNTGSLVKPALRK